MPSAVTAQPFGYAQQPQQQPLPYSQQPPQQPLPYSQQPPQQQPRPAAVGGYAGFPAGRGMSVAGLPPAGYSAIGRGAAPMGGGVRLGNPVGPAQVGGGYVQMGGVRPPQSTVGRGGSSGFKGY